MSELPSSFYLIVGILVLSNVGAIISIFTLLFKAGRFVGETEAGIEQAQKTANLAHKKIEKHIEVYHG